MIYPSLVLAGIPGSPAAIYHFLMDAAGEAVQSCRVQSEGMKKESKRLQETGLPASLDLSRVDTI